MDISDKMDDNLKINNIFSVEGIVAVITGGATGIGLMMTKTLAANGAKKIYVIGRRAEKLNQAAKLSPVIIPVAGDVTSKPDLERIASRIASESGHVNLLVCNSGMLGPNVGVLPGDVSLGEYAAKAFAMDSDEFNRTMEVNVTAVLWTAYAFLHLLGKGNESAFTRQRGGLKSQILVTSSIAALNKMPATGIAYKSSKAAAAHMAKNMSSTFAAFDIRANAIAPGLFYSELAAGLLQHAKGEPSDEGAFEKSYIPAGRTGREEEMGGTIVYMASRAGGYLNGSIIVLDGGRLNIIPGY